MSVRVGDALRRGTLSSCVFVSLGFPWGLPVAHVGLSYVFRVNKILLAVRHSYMHPVSVFASFILIALCGGG
jgi:hypothetical protein